ncbi:MAG: FAD-binding protein [Rhodobacteraceae bacterium]|nr:FAD-binding protein [Paracoccaceae bacterium]
MKPGSEAELAEAIGSATDPLVIIGGGTKPIGTPVEGESLSVSGIAGIRRYEPQALTLVAGAGTPVAEINHELARHKQMLAFEPMDCRDLLGTDGEPTIGGIVAANMSGPRRVQTGACRDYLLGVRFIDGSGRVIRNGGRVMKNVTGYDLVRLLAGSHGTLGVLTEIALKVLPRPEAAGVLLLTGLTDQDAVRCLEAALTSPFEVTGAAHTPRGLDGDPVTMIRVEGFEDSVRYRCFRLRDLLREFGDIDLETGAERIAAGWKWVRDVECFGDEKGDVWRISTKPGDAPSLVENLRRQTEVAVLYDWGGGLVWIKTEAGTDLREGCGDIDGHATLIRASVADRLRLGVFHPQPDRLRRISLGLKAKFDPRGILNPGLMN